MADHDRGVWGLSEIGELLEVNGVGEAVAMLRDLFGREMRSILAERCRTVMIRELGIGHRHDGREAMRSRPNRHGAVRRAPEEPDLAVSTVSRAASAGRTLTGMERAGAAVVQDDAAFADLLARFDPGFRSDHRDDDGDEDRDVGSGTDAKLPIERPRIRAAARIGFARSRAVQ